MRPRKFRAIWLAPLLALSCSQPPDLSTDIEEYANLIDDSIALVCECHVDAGYSSSAECNDTLGFVGLDERQCITDALEGDENEGKDYLACASEAYGDYISCLDTNALAGCEGGGVAACESSHNSAQGACTQLPSATRAIVSGCTTG